MVSFPDSYRENPYTNYHLFTPFGKFRVTSKISNRLHLASEIIDKPPADFIKGGTPIKRTLARCERVQSDNKIQCHGEHDEVWGVCWQADGLEFFI